MDHLTEPELAGYRQRTLESGALLRVADHLAECEECRGKLRTRSGAALVELRKEIESHVSADQLQQFVSGELPSDERAAVEQHLEWCAECASDVRAVREFASAPVSPTVRRANRPVSLWWMAVAAAALLVAIAVGVRLNRPAVVAALNDSGARITLDSKGRLSGIAGLTAEEMASVRQVMERRPLTPSADLTELQPPRGALMGEASAAAFHLISPVGTVVRSTRPELQWTSRGPGTTYVVTLKNMASGQVISSARLPNLTWTPTEPLQPGAIYAWQVAASLNGREDLAPTPPSPQARFQIVSATEASELGHLPHSHLVRATVYLRYGLLDDAQHEAETLKKENPDSIIASELLNHIESLP